MANEERKIRYGIKGKLISAIAMLLVAVIMTVSSTYAWFTLSTAPEVTGISTAVGANGALEMVLLTQNADGTWAYDTGADIYGDKNTTWGNLVDLSTHANYGSDKIILYPSALNTTLAGRVNMDSPLYFPQYGADGRVSSVNGSTMLAGNYKANGAFKQNPLKQDYGFRAVGTTSGLSERQIALRDATSQLNILKNQAKDAAEEALDDNGAVLANMAIQKVLRDDPHFGPTEYQAVEGMIEGLNEALAILDEAYQQAVLAWAASNATSADNTAFLAVKAIVEDNTNYANFAAVKTAVEAQFDAWEAIIQTATQQTVELSLPAWIVGDGLTQFNRMKTDVETAETRLTALSPADPANPEYSYADMSNALQPLVNMNTLKVNDIALNSDGYKDAIMGSAIANKAVWVSMETGSGVFADVADQCGNYQVSIQVDVGEMFGGGSLPMDAAMLANTTLPSPYLQVAIDTAKTTGAPANAAGATAFSEFYGYIIDLGFRTNAAASNLLLQQDAIDRIYADNNNETTMGHGSSMTFTSTSTGFSTDSVKELMEHIRIVFFDTEGENTILVYAKLDMTKATVSSGSVTAPMYLYETVDNAFTYDGTLNRTVHLKDGKYYWDEACTMLATGVTAEKVTEGKVAIVNPVLYKVTTEGETPADSYYYDYYTNDASTLASDVDASKLTAQTDYEVVKTDNVITSLTQNAVHKVSALVYLDGKTITNEDVAADARASMTGTANFQFASDANLVPMEYGNLHTPNAPENNS